MGRTNATKWLNRIDQGFSPGYDDEAWMRPERAPERDSERADCFHEIEDFKAMCGEVIQAASE
jgi:hypothetical protein